MSTTSSDERKFYCDLHGRNMTHHTKDCFKMKQRAKCAKANPNQAEKEKIVYKDLNAFVNAKVTAALKKAQKECIEKKTKK
eukprot:14399317-Ditylum_brightwellii.AAC.1